MRLPFEVADYVDFYSSEHHATNVGQIFRPGQPPLHAELEAPADRLPRPRRHGRRLRYRRSSARAASARRRTRARRRTGRRVRLDIEAEVGFVVGVPTALGDPGAGRTRSPITSSAWCCSTTGRRATSRPGSTCRSARSSASRSRRRSRLGGAAGRAAPRGCRRRCRIPPVLPLPARDRPIRPTTSRMQVAWNGTVVSEPPSRTMYWTPAQQLAHLTVNGAPPAHRRSLRLRHGVRAGAPTRPDRSWS